MLCQYLKVSVLVTKLVNTEVTVREGFTITSTVLMITGVDVTRMTDVTVRGLDGT